MTNKEAITKLKSYMEGCGLQCRLETHEEITVNIVKRNKRYHIMSKYFSVGPFLTLRGALRYFEKHIKHDNEVVIKEYPLNEHIDWSDEDD